MTPPSYNDLIERCRKLELENQELKHSVNKYHQIIEKAPESIVITDKNAVIEFVNPIFSQVTGYSFKEAVGQKINLIKSGFHSKEFYKELWETINNGKVFQDEFQNRKKNGELFWEFEVISPILNEQNEISNFIAIKQDISEKKRIEEALRESESMLGLIFNNSNVGIAMVAQNGLISACNPAFGEILGYASETLPGMRINQFTFIEDIENEGDYNDLIKSRKVDSFQTEQRYVAGNQKIIWARVSVKALYNNENELQSFIYVIENIDKIKNAEQVVKKSQILLRAVIDAAPFWISCLDANGVFILANNNYSFTFNKPIEEIEGKHYSEVLPTHLYERHKIHIDQCLSGETVSFYDSFEGIYPIQTLGIYTPLYDHHKEIAGAVAVVIDITEQKDAEEKLKELTEELRNTNATKDKFFSIIAHDLKNPFNIILGFSSILLENLAEYQEAEVRRFLNMINDAAENAFKLLENLLQWARSQTGTLVFNPSRLDLMDMFEYQSQFFKNFLPNKQLHMEVDLNFPVYIYADSEMVKTILRNLIQNAIKYSHIGGIIRLSATVTDHFAKLCISDNGVGIPPDSQKKLFRIDSALSTKGTGNEKGTGLGLILCKELVAKHEGEIWVESTAGFGSCFYFTLPLFTATHGNSLNTPEPNPENTEI